MALWAMNNQPTVNKENSIAPGKGIVKAPLIRHALGDVQNHGPKSRVPVVRKPATVSQIKPSEEPRNDNVRITRSKLNIGEKVTELKAQQAFSSQLLPPDVPNVDEDDSDNPLLCSVYVMDIFDYLRHLEMSQSIAEGFMKVQTEITPRMRTILVDWLIQVHDRFQLLPETLHLTICFVDRFLEKQVVSKSNFQLLGVSAMFLASKYEEMVTPEVTDFVYITDSAYKKREIFKMEMAILRALSFDLGRPLPMHFLRRYSKVADCDINTHTLTKYLLELALLDHNFSHHKPSMLAAAALLLSLKCQDNSWNRVLAYYTTYQEEDLLGLVGAFANLLLNAEKSKQQTVREKYSKKKLLKVSLLPQLTSRTVKELAK